MSSPDLQKRLQWRCSGRSQAHTGRRQAYLYKFLSRWWPPHWDRWGECHRPGVLGGMPQRPGGKKTKTNKTEWQELKVNHNEGHVPLFSSGRWNSDLQRCRPPNPRTCEYITWHGKRGFADVIKVKNPEMERLTWVIQLGAWILKSGEAFPICGPSRCD